MQSNMTFIRLRLHRFSFFLSIWIILLQPVQIVANSDVTEIPSNIAEIFPGATRIGKAESNLSIIPVYQLSQLLGFVFETDNITNFIGFSGQTINILIGIDPNGIFVGLKVLNHHEPIFLHGLGEQPMINFVENYNGHSIKERYIINARNKNSPSTTYFDGISSATISVIVINDTIITSALKVAREKLDGFAAAAKVNIDPDIFQQLDFEQLVEQGYINHWQLSTTASQNIAAELSYELTNVIDDLSHGSDNFIDVYYAFANIPIIGKNLLGKKEYKRLLENLKPGEHALMVFNRGAYPYISEDFIPQTVPTRLSVQQGEFPVDIRDIDFYSFYDPSLNLVMPDFNLLNVFRIKSQSGFEINQLFTVSLAVSYNKSFLDKRQYKFSTNSVLPEILFITPKIVLEKRQPLWTKIWLSRSIEIFILSIYLVILSLLFIKQKQLASNAKVTRKVRFTLLVFTILFIGYYSQGQLSVVNIYAILLSLVQGFNINVFLLDPVIFILWVYVFISLFIWGRGMFCGWLCPFGALQEIFGMLAKNLGITQIHISHAHHTRAQKIKYFILFGLVASLFYSVTLAEVLAEIEPFKTSISLYFMRYWPFVLYSVLLLLLSLKIHKFYCRYLCPLGAALAIVGKFPILKWLTRRKECGAPCQLCRNNKCDIKTINLDGSIDYGECIQCLECLVTIESPKLCVVNKDYVNLNNKTGAMLQVQGGTSLQNL